MGWCRFRRTASIEWIPQYLIDQLNRHDGDYQTAFQNIAGWWGLAWFDGAELYLQAHGNEIALGLDSHGIWYYTSDWQHLESAVGRLMDFVVLEKGATVKFDCKHPTYTQTPDFHSLAPQGFTRKAVIMAGGSTREGFLAGGSARGSGRASTMRGTSIATGGRLDLGR